MKPRSSRKGRKKPASEEAKVDRMYKNILIEKRVYRRWVTGTEATISTSAGGVIALTTVANSALISSAPDFSSLAALYTAYRCKAIRVIMRAFTPIPVYTGTVYQTCASAVAFWPWTANTVATTFTQALDATAVKLKSGYESFTLGTTYQGDPDAHLWTGTGAAIGSNEQFGFSCIGTSTTSTASLATWKVIPQYLVEFRMAG